MKSDSTAVLPRVSNSLPIKCQRLGCFNKNSRLGSNTPQCRSVSTWELCQYTTIRCGFSKSHLHQVTHFDTFPKTIWNFVAHFANSVTIQITLSITWISKSTIGNSKLRFSYIFWFNYNRKSLLKTSIRNTMQTMRLFLKDYCPGSQRMAEFKAARTFYKPRAAATKLGEHRGFTREPFCRASIFGRGNARPNNIFLNIEKLHRFEMIWIQSTSSEQKIPIINCVYFHLHQRV